MSAPATMPAERGTAPRRGAWLRELWRSSIGKKLIVAITGFVLILYVIAHMLGNLKAFQGLGASGAAIDGYSEWIRTVGEPVIPREGVLWLARIVLLSCFVIHIVGVIQLTRANMAARPSGHPAPRIQRTLASSTMLIGGLFLLGFVIFHVLHLTVGVIEPDSFTEGTVFSNLDAAFDSPFFVAIYLLAAGFLGLHLYHAVWSALQTWGFDAPNRNPTLRRTATFISTAVAIGFAAVPIAFISGVMDDPEGAHPLLPYEDSR